MSRERGGEEGNASPLRSTSQKWIGGGGGGVGDGESNNSWKEKNGRKPEEETVVCLNGQGRPGRVEGRT